MLDFTGADFEFLPLPSLFFVPVSAFLLRVTSCIVFFLRHFHFRGNLHNLLRKYSKS